MHTIAVRLRATAASRGLALAGIVSTLCLTLVLTMFRPATNPVPVWVLVVALALGLALALVLARVPADVTVTRWAAPLVALLALQPSVFGAASLTPVTPLELAAALAGSCGQIPILLCAQQMALGALGQLSDRPTRAASLGITIVAASTCLVAALAGPPPGSAIVWLVPSSSPLAVGLDVANQVMQTLWVFSLAVTPVVAWKRVRAARGAMDPRARRIAIIAISTLVLLLAIVVVVGLVVLTALSDLDRSASYLVLPIALPSVVLAATPILIAGVARAPEDGSRRTRAAMAAFAGTTGAAAAVLALVTATVLSATGPRWLGQLAGVVVFAAGGVGVWLLTRWVATELLHAPQHGASAPNPAEAPPSPGAAADRGAGLSPLTVREREVLALVALGHSNAGIARILFTSPRTVDSQVSSIFAKLGITRDPDGNQRVQAAMRWVNGR